MTLPKRQSASPPRPSLVSINLCCYNGEAFLQETLESIAAQTYPHWELVVVNDGSTDGTQAIIDRFAARGFAITCRRQSNQGLGASRNTALSLSRGKFVAFIDQDDLWSPEKLERQIPLFADPEVGLVFCDTIYFNKSGDLKRQYEKTPYRTGPCFPFLLGRYFLSLETVIIRKSVLDRLDHWFDPRFTMIEEADLFTRIAYFHKIAMVDAPLAKWRIHDASTSWRKGHLIAHETDLMIKGLKELIPDFSRRFGPEMVRLKKRGVTDTAFFSWYQGDGRACRRLLKTTPALDIRQWILFALSFLPGRPTLRLARRFFPHVFSPDA